MKRFDPLALRWAPVESDREPGLYEYDVVGRPAFRLLDRDGAVYAPDMVTGIYAALSRWGTNVLRYAPDSVNGTLRAPLRAPLPTLQARAAALCSGLAPLPQDDELAYWNVPRPIAERIARSVDQSLIGE